MAARIRRRLKATQDAEAIADYIAKDSLEAAVRFLENTESTLEDLSKSPAIGSPFGSEHPELANLAFLARERISESRYLLHRPRQFGRGNTHSSWSAESRT